MIIAIEIDEPELRKLVIAAIEEKTGQSGLVDSDVVIFVKSNGMGASKFPRNRKDTSND